MDNIVIKLINPINIDSLKFLVEFKIINLGIFFSSFICISESKLGFSNPFSSSLTFCSYFYIQIFFILFLKYSF